jgi:DNA repair protein RecO (recombination protein O)
MSLSTPRNYKTEGVVLKRRHYGETDRLVTIFTKHHGKITALAKGVRKITSRRAASLEPATQAVFFFAKGKTFDLITQSQLINSFKQARQDLTRVTQTYQILEIIDLFTADNQSHSSVYQILVTTLKALNTDGSKRDLLVKNVGAIIERLGFGQPQDQSESSLKHHLETIAERKLRSKKMLAT